jgi:hypothetical protein
LQSRYPLVRASGQGPRPGTGPLQLADVDVTSSVTWKGPMHKPEMTPRPSVFVISTVFVSQKLGIKEVDDAI